MKQKETKNETLVVRVAGSLMIRLRAVIETANRELNMAQAVREALRAWLLKQEEVK